MRMMSRQRLMTAILTAVVTCTHGCGEGHGSPGDDAGAGANVNPSPDGCGTGGGGSSVVPTWDLTNGVPQFIEASHIDLSRIQMVSRFRSGAGHDYSDGDISDGTETCRSMKHYFVPFDGGSGGVHNPSWTTIPIYSPVKGTILRVTPEGNGWGQQVTVTPDGFPAFAVVIFHVALKGSLAVGDSVAAGEQIGTHAADATWDDLAIWVNVGPLSQRLVSAFDAMSDSVFSLYQVRGATARSDFIIDKATRDANPLQCIGQSFVSMDTLPEFTVLASP